MALIGFALRALMSVALFIIGAFLVLNSYEAFVNDTLDTETFFGPSVSFVAGLGTMLTMVYIGSLKEIRKSVGYVGVANAAFIVIYIAFCK